MTEIVRDRDLVVLVKGNTTPVMLDPTMVQNGFLAGQGVQWADSPNDELMVTYSDGRYGGFILTGSPAESADQYISTVGQQQKYRYAILCAGTWVVALKNYEKYTYQSRIGPGPLIPIVYSVGDRLMFSLRGYVTNQREYVLASYPYITQDLWMGSVAQVPSAANNFTLMIQTSI